MKDLFKKFGLDINKFKTGEYEGDIDISSRNLLGLVEFGKLGIKKVTGDFSCSNNKITSLEYCPNNIGGYFDCSNNKDREHTSELQSRP